MSELSSCSLCPRNCKINRHTGVGFCGAKDKIKVARAALHFWEEPCISGKNGSGTIFFSHCNLACVFCQNHEISHVGFGKEISISDCASLFLKLQAMGAHNINLVTPTPYAPLIMEALDIVKDRLNIPVVYNCGGYENPELIENLNPYIDIYLTDFKYYDKTLSKKYSFAEDYSEFALASLEKMIKTKGEPKIKDGIMERGVIVRHLVLPTCREDSKKIISLLKEKFGTDKFILSLMAQYFPPENLPDFPEINRKITSFEYDSVVNFAYDSGFKNAYIQGRESAMESFVPPFDLSGVD